jgi:hypothetical protein
VSAVQGPTGWPIDNVKYAVADIFSNPALLATVLGAIVSIAIFNWCGVCVTKRLSCTARLSIDACRTVLVWAASLLIGWETFKSAQLLGFLILICGSILYNELLAVVMAEPGCDLHVRLHASDCSSQAQCHACLDPVRPVQSKVAHQAYDGLT